MPGNSVEFKANANGLVVVFDKNEPYESIYEQISKKLESGGFFFQTRYLSTTYRGRKLSAEEEGSISRMMSEKTGARTVIFEVDKDFEREYAQSAKKADAPPNAGIKNAAEADGAKSGAATDGAKNGAATDGAKNGAASNGEKAGNSPAGTAGDASKLNSAPDTYGVETQEAAPVKAAFRRRYSPVDLDERITKYYRGTLRSGRLLSYDGNVVIIGDVNPGAEVEATGNIIVLGNVRGIVHAGADGNKEATVIALNFAPTQLRIADIITRKTERRNVNSGYIPEVASIKGDAIVFEPLVSR